MLHRFAALAISGLAITGAILISPGEAHAREASSGKTNATATAPVNSGKAATNSGKTIKVKPPKYRP